MERPKRRRKQPLGRDSSREFYYVGPPSALQKRDGIEMVHTRGPLINMQCKEMDKKNNQQCKRQTVVGCGICWQHLKYRHYLKLTDPQSKWMGNLLVKAYFLLPLWNQIELFLTKVYI